MMFICAISVLLAPAAVHAAAFPWALPKPTGLMVAVDGWSPAPTPAPGIELLRRQNSMSNTCGYLSGLKELSITCNNPTQACASNTFHGVGGCCDPQNLSACSLPTTCIASADMTKSCVDASCSADGFITKCTESGLPSCYKWIIQSGTTAFTQHGCAASGSTATLQRSYNPQLNSMPISTTVLTVTTTSSPSPSGNSIPTSSSKASKTPIGAIVGGTVGGCAVISLLVIAAIFYRRRKKTARNSATQPPAAVFHGVTEYSPSGFSPSGYSPTKYPGTETKVWDQSAGPVHRTNNSMPPYPGMGTAMRGIVEVDGTQRPVEAPAENTYYAQEYIRR